ncbi:MAG: hypothetical protein DRP58_04265 [Spirochaetes bacterium]|nr:MAG: hypothetical protein DRP58_04265 [Spirochaetota bacterium]
MNTIKLQDWKLLPEQAQKEVYDFFLFVKQQYLVKKQSENEIPAYSHHSANLVKEWLDDSEDAVWK